MKTKPCQLWPALLLALLAFSAPTHAAPKPNVVLFLVDDMGWMDSTPYGSRYYETPNMERFAKRAMRFTDAYATPLCSPTRASILTGKYSARHGILTASGHQPPQPAGFSFLPDTAPATRPLISPQSKNYLEPSEYTLAEALRDAGYRTAHIGKWHIGLTEPHWPEKQGFDVSFHGKPDPGPPSYFSPYGFRHYQSFPDGPPGEYITDRITDEALTFIEENRERPFFLNLWQYAVHGPWGHKEEYTKTFHGRADPRGKQGNPIMASMFKSVDESLGRVLDKLDQLKLTENTIFIFYSDNGGNVHSNVPEAEKTARAEKSRPELIKDWRRWAGDQPPTNNDPLRAGKGTLYEGGTRVPLMVAWPGVVPPATQTRAVVGPIDLYPTLLDLLALKPNPAQKMDGISIAPVLRDPQAKLSRTALFNYFPLGGPAKPGGAWVRQGDFKLIRWFETGPNYPSLHELYNLRDDLGETKNLAVQMPAKVKELDALIDGFFKDTGALVPKPNPAYRADARTASARGSDATALSDQPIDGWRPKFANVARREGALVVEGAGRSPFLGLTGLKHQGPVTLQLRARSAGGAGKVQWRTSDQEGFPPDGQTVEFTLPSGADWSEARVELPVKGSLIHIRLYLPAQNGPVEIDWIEMKAKSGKPQRWDF